MPLFINRKYTRFNKEKKGGTKSKDRWNNNNKLKFFQTAGKCFFDWKTDHDFKNWIEILLGLRLMTIVLTFLLLFS